MGYSKCGSVTPAFGCCLYHLEFCGGIITVILPYILTKNHILYYHMDIFRLTMLKCSYFISPDFLVV